MKRLVICGDSFMSAISYNPNDLDNGYGKHFTELLANKIGWDVITFARGACSNSTIRLQVEEAIKLNPDCILIGLTSMDRFEFPIYDLSVTNYYDKHSSDINNKMYNPFMSLKNVKYKDWPDKSSENFLNEPYDSNLISETLNNIFNKTNTDKFFTDDDISSLLYWFNRFYDCNWKNQQDCWIVQSVLYKLLKYNINFYCINPILYEHEFIYFGDKIINRQSSLNPWNYNEKNSKYRFHTSIETQIMLSELWYDKFKLDGII